MRPSASARSIDREVGDDAVLFHKSLIRGNHRQKSSSKVFVLNGNRFDVDLSADVTALNLNRLALV